MGTFIIVVFVVGFFIYFIVESRVSGYLFERLGRAFTRLLKKKVGNQKDKQTK